MRDSSSRTLVIELVVQDQIDALEFICPQDMARTFLGLQF